MWVYHMGDCCMTHHSRITHLVIDNGNSEQSSHSAYKEKSSDFAEPLLTLQWHETKQCTKTSLIVVNKHT